MKPNQQAKIKKVLNFITTLSGLLTVIIFLIIYMYKVRDYISNDKNLLTLDMSLDIVAIIILAISTLLYLFSKIAIIGFKNFLNLFGNFLKEGARELYLIIFLSTVILILLRQTKISFLIFVMGVLFILYDFFKKV